MTKTVGLKEETYKRLLEQGKMQESFDELINRILDENEEFKRRVKGK